MLKKLLGGAVMAILLGAAGAATASPVEEFQGSLSFQDLNTPNTNGANFTGSFATSPFDFTQGVGGTYSDLLTVQGTTARGFLTGGSDPVSVSITFTAPSSTGRIIGGTGTEVSFLGLLTGGVLTWNNSNLPITFSDGSELLVHMDPITNFTFFNNKATGSSDLTFTVEKVPEPATLALFCAGMIGLGFLAMRRRRRML